MRLLSFSLAFFCLNSITAPLMKLPDNQPANFKNNRYSANILPKSDVSNIQEGKYILHKEKIDSEIELLKLNYPELKSEIISFKFLFAPNQGYKQFFESDGSVFFLLKIYTKHIMPGDMITISDVKYKETNDSNADWKIFETKLLLVYE